MGIVWKCEWKPKKSHGWSWFSHIFPIETGVDNIMDTCWKAALFSGSFQCIRLAGEAPKFETVSLAILLVKAAECYLDLETTGSNKIHQCISVYVLYTVYIYNTYNIPVYQYNLTHISYIHSHKLVPQQTNRCPPWYDITYCTNYMCIPINII